MSIFEKAPIQKSIYVYNWVMEKLLHAEWKFGYKILVNDLIEELQISRRPIMDALKMLEVENFLDIAPQSGTRVVDPSKKEIIDQIKLSQALENLCTELAAQNSNHKSLEDLILFNQKYVDNSNLITDVVGYYQYNRKIHYGITELTNSQRIANFSRHMWNLNDFFLVNVLPYDKKRIERTIKEHHDILLAIQNYDVETAQKYMKEHLYNYIELLEKLPD